MVRSLWRSAARRPARFERCEDRIALSCASWTDCNWQPVQLASLEVPQQAPAGARSQPLSVSHHQYGLTGRGQTVAIIDSGIAYDHVALGGGFGTGYRVVGGWDFTEENDADPYDDPPAGFHGTHVAGILASDDARHLGLAPEVDVVALRVFNDRGESNFAWIERALQWVHDHRHDFAHPITTVNLSLGATFATQSSAAIGQLDDELAQLHRDGIFVAVAAGNDFARGSQAGLNYPAASPYVVPVSSVGPSGHVSRFSQRHTRALAAPGEDVVSTGVDYIYDFNGVTDDFILSSGTSMAAPYVAGASILLRQALQRAGETNIDQTRLYSILRDTADPVPDAQTGQTYLRVNLDRALQSVLQPRVRDLGTVDYLEYNESELATRGSHWYRFRTTHDGLLTIAAHAKSSHPGAIPLHVYAAGGRDTVGPLKAKGQERLDLPVQKDQVLLLKVSGKMTDLKLQIANLVHATPQEIVIHGTAAADQIVLTASDVWQLEINQLPYVLPRTTAQRVRVDGYAGYDHLQVRVANDDSRAVLSPGYSTLRAGSQSIEASNFEQVLFDGGATGNRVARFQGSTGPDSFSARPGSARLTGEGFSLAAERFTSVNAVSTPGQQDVAFLHGSAGDDILVATAQFARLTDLTHRTLTEGFDRVYATADERGVDKAFLYGSFGNEILVAEPNFARLSGERFLRYARNFDRVYADAGDGGLDRAFLYGTAGDELVEASPTQVRLSGAALLLQASRFNRVYVDAGPSGQDRAVLADSPGDDLLIGDPEQARLHHPDGWYQIRGFRDIQLQPTNGGRDQIQLSGPQPQLRLGQAVTSWVSPTTRYHIRSFHQLHVYATDGLGYAVLQQEDALAPESQQSGNWFVRLPGGDVWLYNFQLDSDLDQEAVDALFAL